jgi:hypothetical protein
MLLVCYEQAKSCIGQRNLPGTTRSKVIFWKRLEVDQLQQSKYTKTSVLAHRIKDLVDQEYMANWMSLEYVGEKVRKNTAHLAILS